VSVLAQTAPVDIMVEDAAAPWSQADGTGYANDVVRAAFAAAKFDVRLVVVPYARCKALALAGSVAACFSMAWEPQLAGRIVFARQPIFKAYARVYGSSRTPNPPVSLDKIPAGSLVGIVNGYEYPSDLSHLRERGVAFDLSDSEAVILRKLAAGRIDLGVLMLDAVKTETKLLTEAAVDNVRYLFPAGEQGSYIGFSVVHPQGAAARAAYDQGFEIISRNDALKAVADKWHLPLVSRCLTCLDRAQSAQSVPMEKTKP
jgi:ABC-type amino acid transport substrate-binding protein